MNEKLGVERWKDRFVWCFISSGPWLKVWIPSFECLQAYVRDVIAGYPFGASLKENKRPPFIFPFFPVCLLSLFEGGSPIFKTRPRRRNIWHFLRHAVRRVGPKGRFSSHHLAFRVPRATFQFRSEPRDPNLFRKPSKAQKQIRLLKRAMVEKNGQGINTPAVSQLGAF